MAITIDDFSKIWASTSPLTPYEFSEDNYKSGWNFVGGTPPSRQMWDFLQKNNDEKMQYLANNYLPLSGGTMTGVINHQGLFASSGSDAGNISIGGGSGYGNGGLIILYGKNNDGFPGRFALRAYDGVNSYYLTGDPNGRLSWDGKKVTVNSNIEDVTITTDSTNVGNVGIYNNAYRCGCVVTIGFNFQIKAGVASGSTIFTGLPKPKKNIGMCLGSQSGTIRGYINTSGELKLDGAGPSSIEWTEGCITYITVD